MAIDEAMLRCNLGESNPATLRVYGWRRPAVSLGYFQDAAKAVNHRYCRTCGIDMVRRPTGGRAVYHGHDLTYAVVSRENDARFRAGIMETYRTLSECIRRGLKRAGIDACMADEAGHRDATDGRGCCFSVPAQYELCAGGRKICGSAQMRVRGAFLQHGSIPLTCDVRHLCMIMNHAPVRDLDSETAALTRRVTAVDEQAARPVTVSALCRYLKEGFEEFLGIRLSAGELTQKEKETEHNLLIHKYRTDRWNREGVAGNGYSTDH